MTPQRLKQIRAIFEATLDYKADERDSFLTNECAGDRDLEQQVRSLMDGRDRAPAWLAQPVWRAAPQPVQGMEGRELSGYRLTREIGSGGMGSVYLAERNDGTFQKQVAIKLVRAGRDSTEILERFRRERQILASLDHPNIARLLDGGSTEEGIPYFVMELVDGLPLLQWADEHKLDIRQRLELFRKVCEAVSYAHRHLVVHRDLKPANILVTVDGSVKLLDFGIAKLLDPEPNVEAGLTETLNSVMTPDYASPEQVKGTAITTSSDVYSLGVILYELLTGNRPYNLTSKAMHEVLRAIIEDEPARPSESAGSGNEKLRKELTNDLDDITLMALRKEPDRRYRSVEALSEDIERHLEDLPISARKEEPWYRLRRFVRRHPAGLLALAVMIWLLATGVVATVWQTRSMLASGAHAEHVLLPQFFLLSWILLAILAVVVFLTRATPQRFLGAVAGGAFGGVSLLWKYWFDVYAGWWHPQISGLWDPMFLAMFGLVHVAASAAAMLLLWRLSRRFGTGAAILVVMAVAPLGAFKERAYWAGVLPLFTASFGLGPILGDTLMWVVISLVSLGLMRLVAGPARGDRLLPRRFGN